MGGDKDLKFGTQVDHNKFELQMTNDLCKGCSHGHVTHFRQGAPIISLEWLNLDSSNFVHRPYQLPDLE